ncbi:hypothetical protein ACI3LY_001613 [Candidozyma auris]
MLPQVIGRDSEVQLLRAFITGDARTSSPNVIIKGFKSSGKTHVVRKYLDSLSVNTSYVNCDECLTHKLLLQRCLKTIKNDSGIDLNNYQQRYMYKGLEAARISVLCENFAYFLMSLEQFFNETGYSESHVLVLDRFDECCDPTDELFASFLKLQEHSSIRNLSIVYIVSHDDPKVISTFSVPRVYFRTYEREEVVRIVQCKQLFKLADVSEDANSQFWNTFAKLVVDLYYDFTGSDVVSLLNLCEKLWPQFAEQVESGRCQPSDIVRIYRDLKNSLLNDNIITNSLVDGYRSDEAATSEDVSAVADLPYHSKFILIAAYLASYVEQKYDLQQFSRIKSIKKRQRAPKEKSITKSQIDSRLLSAGHFDLERLKAILSVIYRNESKTLNHDSQEFINLYQDMSERELARKDKEFATFTLNPSVDVNTQLSTLNTLGLIDRTYASDILSSKTRWKCTTSWNVIADVCREIQFPIHNYLVER